MAKLHSWTPAPQASASCPEHHWSSGTDVPVPHPALLTHPLGAFLNMDLPSSLIDKITQAHHPLEANSFETDQLAVCRLKHEFGGLYWSWLFIKRAHWISLRMSSMGCIIYTEQIKKRNQLHLSSVELEVYYHKCLLCGKKFYPLYAGLKHCCPGQLWGTSITRVALDGGMQSRNLIEATEGSFWQMPDLEWLSWRKLAKHHGFCIWERRLSKLWLLSRQQAQQNTQKLPAINRTLGSFRARIWCWVHRAESRNVQ